MPHLYDGVVNIWKKKYSDKIGNYTPFELTRQFERFAKLFAPGDSYFYILNMHNLSLDYVSETVTQFTGKQPQEASIQNLLAMALPEELKKIEKKEALIDHFFNSHLSANEILNYKIVYSYRMRGFKEKLRTMLLQAIPLAFEEKGTPEHILAIHSDISHLNVMRTHEVSFIHMDNGESFYNLDPNEVPFTLKKAREATTSLYADLTKREKEIVKHMAKGYDANYIADLLFLSVHTVQTHRKNILRKTNCSNAAELVAKCLMSGLAL